MDRSWRISSKQFRRLSEEEQLDYLKRVMLEEVEMWLQYIRDNGDGGRADFFDRSRSLILRPTQR